MRISPLLSGVSVAAVCLSLVLAFGFYDQRQLEARQHDAVMQELHLLRARVEGLLDKYLYLGNGLAAHVAASPEVSSRDFSALMQRVTRDDALLLGVVLLRGDQPSHVYAPPPPINPVSSAAVLRLSSPVLSPQGGTLRHWGRMDIELDSVALLQQAGLPAVAGPVRIAVRGHDGRLLAGSAEVFAAAQAQTEIVLPDGRWSIAGHATPSPGGLRWGFLLGGVGALLGGMLIWWLRWTQLDVHRLALHDCLTGLPNRRLLQDRVQQACAASARSRRWIVLMYLDLDNFKPVNDNHGHHAGDAVLCEVAQRLRYCVRRNDTVARVSGDEFVLVLEHLADAREAEAVADKVLAAFAPPIVVGEQAFVLGCSIGLAAMGPGCDVDAAMVRADRAMYQAKRDGKNSYRWDVIEPEQPVLALATETAA